MCLDTPKSSLYDAIMSIVSQDTPRDQEYSTVDKTASGKMVTKNFKIRGTPVIIPTQVIDDTKDERFHEKNRRFVNVNPDTSSKKIHEANRINALNCGYLPEEYDELVVSREDKQRAREIVEVIVSKLMEHSKYFAPKQYGVKIPFALSIQESIPTDKVWAMTVMNRLVRYLSVITKVNMDSRPRIQNTETGQFFPIATTADLKQTLEIMKVAASGIRPYLVNWYNKVIPPLIEEMDGKPNTCFVLDDNGNPQIGPNGKPIVLERESRVGVSSEQIALKTKQVLGFKPGSMELLQKYLYPLNNLGVLNYEKSVINKSQNIWWPVDEDNSQLYSLFIDADVDGNSTHDNDNDGLKLRVMNPDTFPNKNFLKEQFRTFVNHCSQTGSIFEKKFSYYKLLDADGSQLTLDQLMDKYFNDIEDCFVKGYGINVLKSTDERENTGNEDKKILKKLPIRKQ